MRIINWRDPTISPIRNEDTDIKTINVKNKKYLFHLLEEIIGRVIILLYHFFHFFIDNTKTPLSCYVFTICVPNEEFMIDQLQLLLKIWYKFQTAWPMDSARGHFAAPAS